MLCPTCKSSIDQDISWRTLLIVAILFLLIGASGGFIGGQLFNRWQIKPVLSLTEERIETDKKLLEQMTTFPPKPEQKKNIRKE
jgi:hypothetical protein